MIQDFVGQLDGILGTILRWASSLAMVMLWILVTAAVIFRVVPIMSMGWSDEIVELAFAWMIFLCSADLCRQRKHFVVDLVGEITQFPIPVTFAMDGYQHRYGIAEIGINYRPHDAGREFGSASQVHFMAQLGPELV